MPSFSAHVLERMESIDKSGVVQMSHFNTENYSFSLGIYAPLMTEQKND